MSEEMQLIINGKSAEFDGVHTVGDLIRARGLKTRLVAVEHNGAIVPRSEFDVHVITDGDRLEIVHFVGGG